jgi:uncharacterized protein (TIGR02270 family)
MSEAVIPVIISQHAEEAAFLWLLRDAAVQHSDYTLDDLVNLDERVEAHLDGLRIAGDSGLKICKEVLACQDAGEVFAAAGLAFELGDQQYLSELTEIAFHSRDLCRGGTSALGWLAYQQATSYIQSLLVSDQPMHRRIGISALAIHRHDPGQILTKAVADEEPIVRARALRAVGELGRADLLLPCQENFEAEDAECRFWATWSAALLGNVKAVQVLRETAENGGLMAQRACDLAVRLMSSTEALGWQKQMSEREEHQRLATMAVGAIGDPILVPWLLETMKIDNVARLAGEAFSYITGVDLRDENFERAWPEGFEIGPTEDPEDENVDMDSDEDLPWPKPEAIHTWWRNHQGQFRPGTRYLLGKPMSRDWLWDVLRNGRQRQRAAAALELALQQPGQPLFEVRAPGFRQQQLLRAHS